MNLTRVTSALTWKTAKGRELIRLDESADAAEVVIGRSSEDELRALAQAALEAADQIAAGRMDSKAA
jgi:hypothetical protein